jgi:rRNA maturation endonuclease Nob1
MTSRYRPRFQIKRRCHACTELFSTTRTDAKFCSARCRQAFSRYMRRELGDSWTKKNKPRKG